MNLSRYVFVCHEGCSDRSPKLTPRTLVGSQGVGENIIVEM